MVRVRTRPETGKLYLDFGYRGKRCREYTALADTLTNRRQVQALARRIERELHAGSFEYARYFPGSPHVAEFATPVALATQPLPVRVDVRAPATAPVPAPTFGEFAEIWFKESEPRWRSRYHAAVRDVLDKHLLPRFGGQRLDAITRADLLDFRAEFAKRKGRRGANVSAKRTNKVMSIFKAILSEGCDRFGVMCPAHGIKPLRQKRSDIQPFSLDEVNLMIGSVRKDYKAYLIVRFFTGLRTAEVNGLQWQDIDFQQNTLRVQRAVSRNGDGQLKTETSYRTIPMVPRVREALSTHWRGRDAECPWVFHSKHGNPVDAVNFTNRVWYPLLRLLALRARAPYQTRHTAATLMLAAGENAEWVARMLGHSTTEMLFRVYSRFIPNLTRNDGLAFAGLLRAHENTPTSRPSGYTAEQLVGLSSDQLRELLLQRPSDAGARPSQQLPPTAIR